jgi:hypothetical protein
MQTKHIVAMHRPEQHQPLPVAIAAPSGTLSDAEIREIIRETLG